MQAYMYACDNTCICKWACTPCQSRVPPVDLQCSTFDFQCPMFSVRCLISDFLSTPRRLTCRHVDFVTKQHTLQTSQTSSKLAEGFVANATCTPCTPCWSRVSVRFSMSDFRCSMFEVRFSMSDVRCTVIDVRCSMFDVRCSVVFDVRCSMLGGVRCSMLTVQSAEASDL